MKMIHFHYTDDSKGIKFSHKEDFSVNEGESVEYSERHVTHVLPWHRVLKIEDYDNKKAYIENYIMKAPHLDPILEDHEQRLDVAEEVAEILERLPGFLPSTGKMKHSELSEKIKNESENLHNDAIVQEVIELGVNFDLMDQQLLDDGGVYSRVN